MVLLVETTVTAVEITVRIDGSTGAASYAGNVSGGSGGSSSGSGTAGGAGTRGSGGGGGAAQFGSPHLLQVAQAVQEKLNIDF
jgi:hypothetical protein